MHTIWTQIHPEQIHVDLVAWTKIHVFNDSVGLICKVQDISIKGKIGIVFIASDETILFVDENNLYEKRTQ